MKLKLLIPSLLALLPWMSSCDKEQAASHEREGNSIVINPYKQWNTSKLPAYIGDISALPKDLQTVVRQRFPKQVSMEAAGVIIAGASDIAANTDKLALAAENGAFVIVPSNVEVPGARNGLFSIPSDAGNLTPLITCYSGWGAGQYYVMLDGAEAAPEEPGASSMSEKEWKELIRKNKAMGEDGGVSLTDYDNDAAHNENYYQTRMDPFVEWLESTYLERTLQAPGSWNYDDLRANIEQSGQRLTYNYPFDLNAYIDKALWSDPDYLAKSGSISVEYRIYPIYMLSANGNKAGDYYAVVSTVTPHNQSLWGPYVAAHGACRNRIYGFWFSDMDVTARLLNPDGTDIYGLEFFNRPLPENKNDSKSYSKGSTFSLTGSFNGGYSGGRGYAVGGIALGGTWTSTTNYTLETISYTLDSSLPIVKYHYWSENVKLTDDWDDWNKINQDYPAPVRSEFSSHTMWVWHIPYGIVKDYETRQFKLITQIRLHYSTWYHWRGALEYDSNKKDYEVRVPPFEWDVQNPDRIPWGFIRLRNATDHEMAHVSFYENGQESGDPLIQLSTSYGKGEEARVGLPEGTYNVTWDIVDGNTGAILNSWIYRNVKVHQGYNDETSTIRISSVDGEQR